MLILYWITDSINQQQCATRRPSGQPDGNEPAPSFAEIKYYKLDVSIDAIEKIVSVQGFLSIDFHGQKKINQSIFDF